MFILDYFKSLSYTITSNTSRKLEEVFYKIINQLASHNFKLDLCSEILKNKKTTLVIFKKEENTPPKRDTPLRF